MRLPVAMFRGCVVASLFGAACSAALPADVPGYESRCDRMNTEPIPRTNADPHNGTKNVYACNVAPAALEANQRPFADGTVIVKESRREGEDLVWLIATARKQGGAWQWDEYTRNFADEEFRHVLAGESVCTDCHVRVRGADWIFTTYAAP
jgi:hypothetical protein